MKYSRLEANWSFGRPNSVISELHAFGQASRMSNCFRLYDFQRPNTLRSRVTFFGRVKCNKHKINPFVGRKNFVALNSFSVNSVLVGNVIITRIKRPCFVRVLYYSRLTLSVFVQGLLVPVIRISLDR